MADLERTYNVPLRKEFRKAASYKRTAKAMRALQEFLKKHMKSENIVIGQALNKEMWKHGIKNPPHHIKVTAVKDGEGVVRAELHGVKWVEVKQKAKREEDSTLLSKIKSKMGVDETEEETKETKTDKKEVKETEKKASDVKKTEKAPEKKEVKPAEKKEVKQPEKKEVKQTKLSEKETVKAPKKDTPKAGKEETKKEAKKEPEKVKPTPKKDTPKVTPKKEAKEAKS